MDSLNINETPVRTSKSFNINNIKIDKNVIKSSIKSFNTTQINVVSSKDKLEEVKTEIDLKYGLGDELTEEVKEKSNQNYKLTINSKMKNDVVFHFKFDNDNTQLVENIDITAIEGTMSNIIIKYDSLKDVAGYHNGIIKLFAQKNSNVNIIIANFLNDESYNFLAIQNEIMENAKVNYTIIDFGGEKTITNYYSNIKGDFAENNLNAIYLGKDKQVIDMNYIAELFGKKSKVNIEVQGALKDKARKNFKGTIDFKKGAQKSKGDENENCMLLSDTAKSLALPMLLCSEENVEGSHSSSAGKIGEKELFYIMSRGFELKDAQKLLVRANFNKILENISNEDLKKLILNEIDNKLD